MGRLLARYQRDLRGGTAVEYALVLPIFITLMVGTMCVANLSFAINSLHFAVEDAARCAAVKTTVCTDSGATVSYAQGRYSGPQISANFSYSATGCGHTVSASGSYPIILAAATLNVPISASACYP
ncbi:MAG TPA: TadE family protein [Phenylobacterium sp.]|jgi:Flp pilus assembly pilin Flp|nr:TadE family protein [Phenylobacterium sp.]